MSNRIFIFNFIYYAVTIGLVKIGMDDPSSSLGYGYFIIIFWIIAAVLLVFLLVKKILRPKTVFEKVGVFAATPLLSIILLSIFVALNKNESSDFYFYQNGYQYKRITFYRDKNTNGKRIEYYKGTDPDNAKANVWIKDSTWVYLSEAGDTIKSVKYKDGIEVK
jgi:glucan phosphoethanolaminetransferase (alkaline phosphatase superfamily)